MQGLKSLPLAPGVTCSGNHCEGGGFLSKLAFLFFVAFVVSGCSAQGGTAIVSLDSGGGWQARVSTSGETVGTLGDAGLLPAMSSLSQDLEKAQVSLSWDTTAADQTLAENSVRLEGDGGSDKIRSLIYSELSPYLSPLDGPARVELVGSVRRGETLDFTLENNPSTGYFWEPVSAGLGMVRLEGEESLPKDPGLVGGGQRQVFHYTALADGTAAVRWVYRRPWEEAGQGLRVLKINAPALSDVSDLSDPRPVPATVGLPLLQDQPQYSGLSEETQKLPAQFDWRAEGKLTPVRNQGGCGSCWAFATVGVLESAIKIQDNVGVDLSEQYLVSCNQNQWSCDGGWLADDYHWTKLGRDGGSAGAVLEAAFPYQADDVACGGPYAHSYQIRAWHWIGANEAAIKQAIYNYGAVETTICVGPKFSSYDSGVFGTDETSRCGGSVNHAVVLVGWDDTKGAHGTWILRNSWGPGWGEDGYMEIDRAVSNVGYASVYVDYKGPITTHQAAVDTLLPYYLPLIVQ